MYIVMKVQSIILLNEIFVPFPLTLFRNYFNIVFECSCLVDTQGM